MVESGVEDERLAVYEREREELAAAIIKAVNGQYIGKPPPLLTGWPERAVSAVLAAGWLPPAAVQEQVSGALAEAGQARTTSESSEDLVKTVAAGIKHLQHEIDRLTAGADDSPVEPGVNPTPSQWIARWNAASAERRLAWAEAIIDSGAEARNCLMQDHVGELSALQGRVDAALELCGRSWAEFVDRPSLQRQIRDALTAPPNYQRTAGNDQIGSSGLSGDAGGHG